MTSTPSVSELNEAEVVRLLSIPQLSQRLGNIIGTGVRATALSDQHNIYAVAGSGGDFILRFPEDEAQLAVLRNEERIQAGLRSRVAVLIPDTRVIDGLDGCPVFAIHRMIPGEPLTSDSYSGLAPEVRERLVGDLAGFFRATHGVPLPVACEWLASRCDGERTLAHGKPTWFGPPAVAEMRPKLGALTGYYPEGLFEETVRLFEALETNPDYMVFGHGDIHGGNVAMGQDDLGAKLVGVFDLGCAGILDIHEDLFRLSLVSDDLLERVMAAYRQLPGQARPLDRARIAIYYRAFLFYLMAEVTGRALEHLKALLSKHLKTYSLSSDL